MFLPRVSSPLDASWARVAPVRSGVVTLAGGSLPRHALRADHLRAPMPSHCEPDAWAILGPLVGSPNLPGGTSLPRTPRYQGGAPPLAGLPSLPVSLRSTHATVREGGPGEDLRADA